MSYSRGSVSDIRGVLVQFGRAGYDRISSLRGEGPPQGPSSGEGYSTIDAEVAMPRIRASWVPKGATYRASVELSCDFIPRADRIYATFFSVTPVGGGRG